MPESGPEYVSLDGNSNAPWYRRLVQTSKSTDRKMVVLCIMGVVIIALLSYILISSNNCPQPDIPVTTTELPITSSSTHVPTTPTTTTAATTSTTTSSTTTTATPKTTTSEKPPTPSEAPLFNISQPIISL